MTAIAGLVEDGVVYLGGDSSAVAGWSLDLRCEPKVFRRGEFVFGFTTSFRFGQLLKYALKLPGLKKGQDVVEFLVVDLMDCLRKCLGEREWKDCSKEEGGEFLLGFRGRLFEVDADFQVGEPLSGVAGVGCGGELCRASLLTSLGFGWAPEDRVRRALEVAERLNMGVRGPFHVVSV